MSALPMAPPPISPLGRYRLLSPTASARLSPLCLGAMNFGDAWKDYMGACDQKTTEAILDFFYEQGGNFIDTANNYQFEQSETWIGEWMKKRGNRDQMFIATKYTTNFRAGHGNKEIMANFTGNGTKSLHTSVEASLKKLQTDYIDLLYVHWWDFSASIPELMQSLNHLVAAGKVLYLGISDTPAWVVSKANQYARDHSLRQFSVYQGRWSAASRDFEREIIPMARDEGMALAPWGALGGGKFKTEEQRKAGDGRKVQATEAEIKVSKVLESIAKKKGTVITSIALAYVMHKAPYVFPIVGGRTVDHLKSNIEALTLSLSDEEVDEIDNAVPFELGFPNSFFYLDGKPKHPSEVWLLNMAGTFDYVPTPKPITPSQGGK
ncbi:Norsolorinic acid reductase [Pleurostoma richardsiae]|uniref:Norsolorinic acid reductase n=1 Tax=Pleurostoma richardsiae TaxID=41990 RepID=A0AA38VV03_9PEZI|nr:Norsolorinic acid reductase [Pleurostoma richardsiae]